MKNAIVTTILAAGLVLPGIVLACGGSYVSDVDLAADCDGWNLCILVEFAEGELEVELDYVVTLLGPNEEPLEWTAYRVVVARETTEVSSVGYCVTQTWEGYHDNPPFQVAAGAEICGTEAMGEVIDVDCVVANDEQTWDHFKSLYR